MIIAFSQKLLSYSISILGVSSARLPFDASVELQVKFRPDLICSEKYNDFC